MIAGKHTRGLWRLMPAESDKAYLRIRGSRLGERFKIANVLNPLTMSDPNNLQRDLEETRANARLIATSPELFDALQPFVVHNSSEETITITVRTADVTRARRLLAWIAGEVCEF